MMGVCDCLVRALKSARKYSNPFDDKCQGKSELIHIRLSATS